MQDLQNGLMVSASGHQRTLLFGLFVIDNLKFWQVCPVPAIKLYIFCDVSQSTYLAEVNNEMCSTGHLPKFQLRGRKKKTSGNTSNVILPCSV